MTPRPAVVIVGGGQAGVQAAASLREAGGIGAITIVADEVSEPYQRPPLSKDFLDKGGDPTPLPLRGDDFFLANDIALLTGRAALSIDRANRVVVLDDGTGLPYDALILATGSTNRSLTVPGIDLEGVFSLRTLEDAKKLRASVEAGDRAVVVGAGFIGLEFAASARTHALGVTVLEAADRPLARAVSTTMSEFFTHAHEAMGVDLRCNEVISSVDGVDGRVVAVTSSLGHRYEADLVVVGVGVVPSTHLAAAAGLEVDNGIVVNHHLQTSDPAIYAIGDCVSFPSPQAGEHVRVESVQNATDQARHVARVVAGERVPYAAVPWFWSNQGPYRLQIAGLIGANVATVVRGDPDANKFSVFAFADGHLTAVESLNSPADHMASRKLLEAGRGLTPEQAMDTSFNLRAHVRGH